MTNESAFDYFASSLSTVLLVQVAALLYDVSWCCISHILRRPVEAIVLELGLGKLKKRTATLRIHTFVSRRHATVRVVRRLSRPFSSLFLIADVDERSRKWCSVCCAHCYLAIMQISDTVYLTGTYSISNLSVTNSASHQRSVKESAISTIKYLIAHLYNYCQPSCDRFSVMYLMKLFLLRQMPMINLRLSSPQIPGENPALWPFTLRSAGLLGVGHRWPCPKSNVVVSSKTTTSSIKCCSLFII